MGKDIIQAEYDQLNRISWRFTAQAEGIQQMRTQLRNKLRDLQNGGWIGHGSDAFFSEMNGLVLPAVTRLQEALSEASRVTTQIIRIMQEAEKEAASKFRGGQQGAGASAAAAENGASAAGATGPTASGSLMVKDPSTIFNAAYMESLIGSRFRGDNSRELNRLTEDLYLLEKNNNAPDRAEVNRLLDRIADIRGVDQATFRQQYETYRQLRENARIAGALPDIDLNKHGGFLGSTVALRYGKVVGDTFGIDPVFGSLLNPSGGLVGPGNDSYRPSANDAIGYHGVVHDAAGYLYNYHGKIGPGYDYLGRDVLSTSSPLSGQVGGIAWWMAHSQLEVDVLPNLMPDIPYVPKFVEQAAGEIAEGGIVQILRVGSSISEGGRDMVDGISDIFAGDFREGASDIGDGATTIVKGIGRSLIDLFD